MKNFIAVLLLVLVGGVTLAILVISRGDKTEERLLSKYGRDGRVECPPYVGCFWIGPDGSMKK